MKFEYYYRVYELTPEGRLVPYTYHISYEGPQLDKNEYDTEQEALRNVNNLPGYKSTAVVLKHFRAIDS